MSFGTYELSVEVTRFQKYVGTGINLHVNESLTVDVTLVCRQGGMTTLMRTQA